MWQGGALQSYFKVCQICTGQLDTFQTECISVCCIDIIPALSYALRHVLHAVQVYEDSI